VALSAEQAAVAPADATVTQSGLAYKVLRVGTGAAHPSPDSRVEVHYTGWTADGEMFESSHSRGKTSTFPLSDVIVGWAEGIQMMVEGEITRYWIHEDLAYKGRRGLPAGKLVYDVELVRVSPAGSPAAATKADTAESRDSANPAVVLDGQLISVSWDDGDTFATPDRKIRARLVGYNTLESYGAVHRWGDWSAAELAGIAKQAGVRASSEVWACTTQPGGGGYGRAAVDCPELRKALLREGLAHVFAIDSAPDESDLMLQKAAIEGLVGMWQKGAPSGIVTSIHSLDERPNQQSTYDRVCSTSTGMAPKVSHAETYAACSEVCHQGSCLLYVPYKQRYGDKKADCLR